MDMIFSVLVSDGRVSIIFIIISLCRRTPSTLRFTDYRRQFSILLRYLAGGEMGLLWLSNWICGFTILVR